MLARTALPDMVQGLKLKFALILHFFIKFRIEIIKVFGISLSFVFFQPSPNLWGNGRFPWYTGISEVP